MQTHTIVHCQISKYISYQRIHALTSSNSKWFDSHGTGLGRDHVVFHSTGHGIIRIGIRMKRDGLAPHQLEDNLASIGMGQGVSCLGWVDTEYALYKHVFGYDGNFGVVGDVQLADDVETEGEYVRAAIALVEGNAGSTWDLHFGICGILIGHEVIKRDAGS